MFRYMSLIWNVDSTPQSEAAGLVSRRLKALCSQWRELSNHDGMRVFCADVRPESLEPHALANNSGVVLGALLKRNPAEEYGFAHSAVLGPAETTQIRDSQGKWLIDRCWGNYVAFIDAPQPRTKCVVKDPTGSLPCYWTQFRGISIFFSSIADCVGLQLMDFSANRSYLSRRLIDGGMSHLHSPLAEVSRIHPGECVTIDQANDPAQLARHLLWSPLRFRQADDLIEDPDLAATAMRATVRSAIHSVAGCHSDVMLRLSGGLDSSIVSGCLKDAPTKPKVTCHTFFDPSGRSDPRPWARIAADHAGFEQIECSTSAGDVHLADALHMPMSVEPAQILGYLNRSREIPLAQAREATAIFNGDGGDCGFCSDTLRYALAEYLRLHRFRPAALRLAAQIGLLTGSSTWTVLARSLRGWRAGDETTLPKSTYLKASRLVSRHLVESFTSDEHRNHPWLDSSDRIPGGTSRRLGMLVAPSDFYNACPTSRDSAPEIIAPLYSQPVTELLLRIPIHIHFEGGRDRGLARRAFAAEVPQPILQRHWKDRAPGFHDELIHRNLDFLREFFLDGVLVSEGLLDRQGLERALSTAPSKSDVFPGELLNHMAAEMWARHWMRPTRQRAVA